MKRLFIIFLLILPLTIYSETQVSVSVSSTTSTIGEQITLKFIVRTSALSDSIRISQGEQDFEFIKEESLEIKREEDFITFEKNYKISFFKTGDFSVGPFNIGLMNGDSVSEELVSNTIPVNVISVLEENDKDIRPLRELSEIKGNPLYLIKYALILLAAAGIIILIIYLLRRKKGEETVIESPMLPPDLEFRKRIESLWRTDMLKTGKVKRFFLTLTEAYKMFMMRSYKFNAEDLTTYEITNYLKKHEQDEKIKKNFDEVFLISDLAKFAKYEPSEDEIEKIRKDLIKIAEIAGERREKKEKEENNASL
ncbi:MAG: hypothetical protein ABFR36_02135 [Acidobacteriota bacterium]